MLETGIKAPEFTLKNQDGEEVSLKDFRGKKVILYFYPKDNTPAFFNIEKTPVFKIKNLTVSRNIYKKQNRLPADNILTTQYRIIKRYPSVSHLSLLSAQCRAIHAAVHLTTGGHSHIFSPPAQKYPAASQLPKLTAPSHSFCTPQVPYRPCQKTPSVQSEMDLRHSQPIQASHFPQPLFSGVLL